ncbi:Nitroreductase [Andreprevotia lacus DSM 23236]|jgi:nitroreductase|uniref:Nitroreductase n=1 Tax=Andreprevotia lacus DSM 23236 TaxID=1121001 RepID=A0A1W1Y197_9NEIS|nr:nitroreductase family protein [Andreprevotia lacus]SMC29907.1 Nitroreductase [Andreprevotia lacus DSM 23236]
MTIQQLIAQRRSCNHFDPDRPLDAASLRSLVALATKAPSAYNSQNWRFIALQTPEAKARLLPQAYGQRKVVDASVTFIICGRLAPHRELHHTLQATVDAGLFDEALRQSMVDYATQGYDNNPQGQRDEAIRSASLAAMTLMLAAEGMGLASCPLSGFDAAGVAAEFALDAHDVPVILVTVGHDAGGNWPQKPRKPLDTVLAVL